MTDRPWALRLGSVGAAQLWLDASWVPLLPLVAWSLAVAYFPDNYPVFGPVLDWVLGLIGAACLWISALLHERAHLVVEGRSRPDPRTVIISVVASFAYPPAEHCFRRAAVAIAAGPLASMLLAMAAFWGALNAGPFSRPVEALLGYLAILNALLALVHCIPVAPFDAGLLLRLVLIRIRVKRSVAERVPVLLGAIVGSCLLLLGIWQLAWARGGLFGAWVALVGALTLWALRRAVRWTTIAPTPPRRAVGR